jgi:hypothetical protein
LATDVGDEPVVDAVPLVTRLHANVPNPFNPQTTIQFEIAGSQAQPTRLFIYDAGGRLVRRLVDRTLAPGLYRESWNGTDAAGRQMASGVYFYQLETAQHRSSRKMILLR